MHFILNSFNFELCATTFHRVKMIDNEFPRNSAVEPLSVY